MATSPRYEGKPSSSIRAYRDGGRGFENVLTAEVLTALDFLPREAFLRAVVRAAHGADAARMMFLAEVEQAEVILLPEEMKLRPSGPTYQAQLVVQPDDIMMSTGCYVLPEAKRIRRSSFQAEQIAREYVALMAAAEGKSPLLSLILGSPPPVTVKGHGRLSVEDAASLFSQPFSTGQNVGTSNTRRCSNNCPQRLYGSTGMK
jgi:hypothetical protein